jgi:hypothetical protein
VCRLVGAAALLAEQTFARLVDGAVVIESAHAEVTVAVGEVHAHTHAHIHGHHRVETTKVHIELSWCAGMTRLGRCEVVVLHGHGA